MDLCQMLKNRNLLGTYLDTFAAGDALSAIDLAQLLILLHCVVPSAFALEMVINGENPGDGDLLGTDIAVITGSAGNQHFLFAFCNEL